MSESFPIRLYFSIDDHLMHKTFNIPPDTSIKTFIEKFNIESILSNEDIEIGVYGKIMKEDYIIKIHDRLEVYAKVKIDPKTRRKKLAKI